MSTQRYVFDHRARKVECPDCGHRTYRTYVDVTNGDPFDPICGICDRENSCNRAYTPWQYMRDKGIKAEYRPAHKLPPPKMKRTDFRMPPDIVARTMDHRGNVFAKWLVGHYGDRAKEVLRMYRVGTYPMNGKDARLRGAIVYWNIGSDDLPRSGKVMSYLPDGHRNKDVPPQWMHTLVYNKKSDDLGVGQVLFGAHLLYERPDADVCVVESEKTAIICACVWPEKVWVATGGSDSFTVERCQDLTGRRVWVFPDVGMHAKWLSKSMNIEVMCESMCVSDVLEAMGCEQGLDLADLLLPVNQLGDVDIFPAQHIPEPPSTQEQKIVAAAWGGALKSPVQKLFEKPELARMAKALDFDIDGATIRPLK